MDFNELKLKVSGLFTPGAPINSQDLFSGRLDQVNDVLNAAIQPGRHVVMFGERGVGKTSLAKVISTMVSVSGQKMLRCGTINCDSSDDFSSLFRKVCREISFTIKVNEPGFKRVDHTEAVPLETILPNRKLEPDDIRYVLTKLGAPCLIIIDEVDQLKGPRDRSKLAATIKNLSDHAVPVTLVLVGIADYVEEIVADHESIERALVPVPLQRMSSNELIEILDKGFDAPGMTVDEGVKGWIARLSQGLPHYTHSLGLYSAFQAIDDGRMHVTAEDVVEATKQTVEKSHIIRRSYHIATSSPQTQNLYAKVLLGCALANADELGWFAAADLKDPMSMIMDRPYGIPNYSRHLHSFCEPSRGPILKKHGKPKQYRFRFINPMMQPFVIIHDYSVGMLTNKLLLESSGRTVGGQDENGEAG